MNLVKVWALLEEDHRTGPGTGRMQRRITPGNRRDFFLGLELPSRNRMLILRAAPASVIGQARVPDSVGLRVQMRDRATNPPRAEIELVLTDQQHRDIFDLLIEDSMNAAERPEDEIEGVGRFLTRISEWQRMLMRLVPGLMSKQNQQGLWGELWALREVTGPAVGFVNGVRAWRGPLGADQDFQLPGAALEVKTSIANTFDRLVIASERQLDVAPDIALALIALGLDARPDNGETLSEMVLGMRSAAGDAGCLNEFEGKLALSGFRPEDWESYSEIGYTVRSRRQFRVEGEFPRIVVEDLRPGVLEVQYSVAVTACTSFEIGKKELTDYLRGGP